ncbi:hypothetical protein Tco_1344202 [Tanacetum coccineum]
MCLCGASLDRLPHRLISHSRCNVTLLPLCGSSFFVGVIFLFIKLLLGILSMIGTSIGMPLKRKNTGSMLLLLRFFGGFEDTEIASSLTLNR